MGSKPKPIPVTIRTWENTYSPEDGFTEPFTDGPWVHHTKIDCPQESWMFGDTRYLTETGGDDDRIVFTFTYQSGGKTGAYVEEWVEIITEDGSYLPETAEEWPQAEEVEFVARYEVRFWALPEKGEQVAKNLVSCIPCVGDALNPGRGLTRMMVEPALTAALESVEQAAEGEEPNGNGFGY